LRQAIKNLIKIKSDHPISRSSQGSSTEREGRLSTLDFLRITILDQLLVVFKILFTF
jgi:hypothetical protein